MQKLKDHSIELRDELLSKGATMTTRPATRPEDEAIERGMIYQRAAAYPRLVEALRSLANGLSTPASDQLDSWSREDGSKYAFRILRELGEIE